MLFISVIACVEAKSYDAASNLTAIPPEVVEGDPYLQIWDNAIERIPRGAFITYSNLRYLELINLGLRYIEEGAFNGLDKLEKIYSQYNEIIELPTDFGPPTKSLVDITWWNNLPSHTVLTFPYFLAFKNLTHLNIGGNYLSTFQSSLIPHTLIYINLGYSMLSIFPNFATYAPMLEEIGVYKCQMHLMLIENVTGLTEVKKLYLGSNKLTTIPNISFMDKLEVLSLHDNQLSSVPDFNDLPFTELTLADNPLVCDMALCWIRMWPWMKTSSIPSDEPVCAGPDEVAGMKLMDVDPTFLECFSGK